MFTKHISSDADPRLIEYLTDKGYGLEFFSSDDLVSEGISNHPDVFFCRLGVTDDAPLIAAKNEELAPGYPAETGFNAACTGKYFIHNKEYTNRRLRETAEDLGVAFVDVRQGYTKCSTVVVDEDSIITYDKGIAVPCEKAGMNVLLVQPGHVVLNGYDTGFIGGTSGRAGNEIIFNGDLSAHPDFKVIKEFIEDRGLICKWFAEYPLTDIGSII